MSATKIADMLRQGAMIDVSLMSDQLKSILTELCEIVIDQGEELHFLRDEIKKFASKSLINESVSSIREESIKTALDMRKVQNDVNVMSNNISQRLVSMQKSSTDQISLAKKEIMAEVETKLKDLKGDYIIASQQIKTIQHDLLDEKETVKKVKEESGRIRSLLNNQKDQTIEIVASRVEKLESNFSAEKESLLSFRKEYAETIAKMKAITASIKNDTRDELHYFDGELKEIKRLIVEAPSFEVNKDGTIDTETLIHAIQRDSRRIDNFNEIIVSVRDQNDKLSALFQTLANCFETFQVQMQDFIVEHNITKNTFVDQIDQCVLNTEDVRKDVSVCQTSVEESSVLFTKSMTTISNTFLQLYSFLSKITTRQLPFFQTFDDELLDCQKILDAIQTKRENHIDQLYFEKCLIKKAHESCRIGEFMTTDSVNQLLNEFKVPFIGVPTLETKKEKKKNIFTNEHEVSHVVQTECPHYSSTDLELRQSVQELQRNMKNLSESFNNIRSNFTSSIDKKADYVTVERMLEKVRAINQKLHHSLGMIKKDVLTCVQKEDIPNFVFEAIESKANETAAGKIDCLICGRQRAALSSLGTGRAAVPLPMLSGHEKSSHDIVYGYAATQRMPSRCGTVSTVPMRRQFLTPK